MKRLVCAVLCLMLLCCSVTAFAGFDKTGDATLQMELNSFYVWGIPADKEVILFEKDLWGKVGASHILLQPGKVLNIYMAYGDDSGFCMLNGEPEDPGISYNLYNTVTLYAEPDTELPETVLPLAAGDFTNSTAEPGQLLYRVVGTEDADLTVEERADIAAYLYYETTTAPTGNGEYSDTIDFYAIVENAQ